MTRDLSVTVPSQMSERLTQAVLDIAGSVPPSRERAVDDPVARARALATAAARQAALTAGGLALPPGPLGWLTVIPELMAVWRIQSRLVADIAGLYGADAELGREQMLYCLFRHTAVQALRDLLVRSGERWVVRQVSGRVLQSIAQGIGLRVGRQLVGKGVGRWLPLIGAMGVSAYAYADTRQVALTAIELFEQQKAAARKAGPGV